MKTLVRVNGEVKKFGERSTIEYPISEWKVGDEIEILDRDNKLLNVARVVDTSNGVVIEMTA